MPSSMAARVAEMASSIRCFFSLSSTSVCAPTLITQTPPDSLARRSWSFSRSQSESVRSISLLIWWTRPATSSLSPAPSTMVVLSLVTTMRRAVPRSASMVESSLRPTSSLMTELPLRTARSCSIALRRSPNPGALTATTLRISRILLTTRVESASPSTSSRTASMRSGSVTKYGERKPLSNCMPSVNSSSVIAVWDSSTVITPSLPTLSNASAMRPPMIGSCAERAATWAISSLPSTSRALSRRRALTTSTAASMPRLSEDGSAPAATLRRNVAAGADPSSLKRGIDAAVEVVNARLLDNAREVEGKEEIAQVAALSAQDPIIGGLIAEAFDKVGKDGVITVEESQTAITELEFTEGMQFDKGYLSPYFVTDPERMEAVLEDAYVLITQGKI